MADFANDLAYPTSEKMVPKVTQDLGSILTFANSSTTATGADQVNVGSQGAIITIDITAITAGSLTVAVQRKDKASGKYVTLLTSAALGSVATTVIKVTPAIAAAANVSAQDWIGETFRVVGTVATGPVTATIGCTLVP